MKKNNHKLVHYYNSGQIKRLLKVCRRKRDRLAIALMSYCGLRVSEMCNLKIEDVNFQERNVKILGKGNKERLVPLNDYVYSLLVSYIENHHNTSSPYVINNLKHPDNPIHRRTAWKMVKKYTSLANLPNGHPHTLRHSFGTLLAGKGVTIERIADLMGHESYNTTRIYISISETQKRKDVSRLDHRFFLFRLFSKKPYHTKIYNYSNVSFNTKLIGRNKELKQIISNYKKGIDTVLIGGSGIGKSKLLECIEGDKVIRLKYFTPVKQSVLELARELFDYGVFSGFDTWDDLRKKNIKFTIRDWIEYINDHISRNEFTLIVDDITDITKKSGKSLNQLNRQFIIFCAAREIKKSLVHNFWKYDKLKIDEFTRYEAVNFIRYLCKDIDFENYKLFETHVLKKSNKNPRAILEIVERAKKEDFISANYARQIDHTGAQKKIDLSPAFIILGALVVASRFIARGSGSIDGYMLAGSAGAFFMILRFFAFRMRK